MRSSNTFSIFFVKKHRVSNSEVPILSKDPFIKFKLKFEKKERGFLTQDELQVKVIHHQNAA